MPFFVTLSRYFHTVIHLKPVQIVYLIFYRVRRIWRQISGFSYTFASQATSSRLQVAACPDHPTTFSDGIFTFLNRPVKFQGDVNWNCRQHGTLWLYHLNYFNYLKQSGMTREKGLFFIKQFITDAPTIQEGMHAHPISIRCMNWILFLSQHKIYDQSVDNCLYSQYQILKDNLEYHLQGNHLLDNAFSLVAGGIYFKDSGFFKKGKQILEAQLPEQVLDDGGHIERSPMYHALVLERVLDCYNLVSKNCINETAFSQLLLTTAQKMLGWLKMMTYSDGAVPHFKDSAPGIALETHSLESYARTLNILPQPVNAGQSGYRRFDSDHYECIVNVGDHGPDYQPGHSHNDMFSFVLYVFGKPVIVDTGTSTYEYGRDRQRERSTMAHNTYQYGSIEQSDIWSVFRLGKRAHCTIKNESDSDLHAEHDGFFSDVEIASRYFRFGESVIQWQDTVKGGDPDVLSTGYIHFHPDIELQVNENVVESAFFSLTFKNIVSMELRDYEFANGFNNQQKSNELAIGFKHFMQAEIITRSLPFTGDLV